MAKKSMIEREKKRIKLHKKYALKRASLLKKYETAESFNSKLSRHVLREMAHQCLLPGVTKSSW